MWVQNLLCALLVHSLCLFPLSGYQVSYLETTRVWFLLKATRAWFLPRTTATRAWFQQKINDGGRVLTEHSACLTLLVKPANPQGHGSTRQKKIM